MLRQKCIRWIFIFSVLTGLFFSGGEGIRLIPFPTSEAFNSYNIKKNSKSYALSIHNSSNSFLFLKSKYQKEINQFLSGGHLVINRLQIRPNNRWKLVSNHRKTFQPQSLVLNFRSDRAPPTV